MINIKKGKKKHKLINIYLIILIEFTVNLNNRINIPKQPFTLIFYSKK